MAQSCFHCGEEIPRGFHAELEIKGRAEPFCCYGCQAIASTILEDGLDNFYEHRTSISIKPDELKQTELDQLALYDDPLLQADFVKSIQGNSETSLSISGITCAACIWLLEREINRMEHVVSFSINHTTHKAALVWREGLRLSEVLLKIRQLGYKAKPYRHHEAKLSAMREKRLSIFRIAIAGIASMQNMMFSIPLYLGMYNELDTHLIDLFRWVSMFMAAPVVLFASVPFYRAALRSLRAKTLGMDVPVSIAISCAYFASAYTTIATEPSLHSDVYFDSVSMFAFFLLLGRFIEMQSRHRYLSDDADIDQLLPETAIKLEGDQEKSIIAHRIEVGDILIVKQGVLAAADGVVTSGETRFDESALSGEYLPVTKQFGDTVHAGTANMENTIHLQVTAKPEQSRISSILRLIAQAQASKPETQRIADYIASYFVAVVLLAATLTGIFWQINDPSKVFVTVLSVLVVTCPCALSLATPTALTSAAGALRKRGFLLAKNHVLESMVAAQDVVFDKTGTLTKGELSISEVKTFGDITEERSLHIASALEAHSHHPIARAFTGEIAGASPVKAESVVNEVGLGLQGKIDNTLYYLGSEAYISQRLPNAQIQPQTSASGPRVLLASEHKLLASFELNDSIRDEAQDTIDALRSMGITMHILSGDREASVSYVGEKLGIQSLHASQSPEQKLEFVETLQKQGRKVVMVGDGINDLPVLAKAELSIAMGSASDLTKLNADAVLLNDHLSVLAHAFAGARRTKRIIIENMAWALGYNICMLPLAASSFVPPYFAALGMSLSSLIVVFNSIRLRKL